jgi:GAF domain-containing protein
MEVDQVAVWIQDPRASTYSCVASYGYRDDAESNRVIQLRAGPASGAHLIGRRKTPFVLDAAQLSQIFAEEIGTAKLRPSAIAPLHEGYGVRGWIIVRAPGGDLSHFTEERMRLLDGLAYRASVALQKSVLLQSEQESAEVASALLEFSRRLAGTAGKDELQLMIVELAGQMLGSPRTWLWLEHGRPGSFRIEATWSEDGSAPVLPTGSVVEFGGTRRAFERGEPFVLQPGSVDQVPVGDDPLAVAPVVLPSGRIGCVAAAAPDGFPERKLRLLAGIANQASLALHSAG